MKRHWKAWLPALLVSLLLLSGCTGPQATASRIFLDLSIDYLGAYQLPQSTFEETVVGGLSAIACDQSCDRIYALSDARQQPRIYRLKLDFRPPTQTGPPVNGIEIEAVTLLKDQQGQPLAPNILDPEGMAITPQQQVFVASEGIPPESPPLLAAFAQQTGQWQTQLQLPPHYFPAADSPAVPETAVPETAAPDTAAAPTQGISKNQGFESLTLSPSGDRVFAATEFPLLQDVDTEQADPEFYSRFLHYVIGDVRPLLIAEHLYPLEPPSLTTGVNGLTELVALDNAGHFLSLERAYSPFTGFSAQLFQLDTAGATDTANIEQLTFPLRRGIRPIHKQPLLNLQQLNLPIQNLEGMALGPQQADGSRLLILISDNGFQAEQATQLLFFQLQTAPH